MPDNETTKTIHRLENLRNSGQVEKARDVLKRHNPFLEELGIDQETAKQALEMAPARLESTGAMQPIELEAIIVLTNRPPLLVKDGRVQNSDLLPDEFPATTASKIAGVEPFIPSVGRIEFIDFVMPWGGTGWVVERESDTSFLIVTNRHVAKLIALRKRDGSGAYKFDRFTNIRFGAAIDFFEENGATPAQSREVPIESFTYIAEDQAADIALARIGVSPGHSIAPLPLASRAAKDGEILAVVGYPGNSPRDNDAGALERYFKKLYAVKRFSPGFARVRLGSTSLLHDCTTLGGNSGSPVISLEQQAVVGLHFSGAPGQANRAVQISTLKDVLAGKRSTVVVSIPETESAEAKDKPHEAGFFARRRGYNRNFLGKDVPLPDIPSNLDLAEPVGAPGNRPNELRYQHFSVVYSNFAKCPAVAALNINGRKIKPIKRKNRTWFFDLRIARSHQLDQEDYGDPAIDRGHMIRRAATNWGTKTQAERANLDSYHYTVAAPQHKDLNRNAGTWLGLENHILRSAKTHGFKASVFTGPILNETTPDLEDTGGKLPLEFWKVVSMIAINDDGIRRLHATAYLLSQGRLIQSLLAGENVQEALEGFEFGEFKTFQIPVANLEQATGYDFHNLRDADPMNKLLESEAASPVLTRPIETLDDIIL